ncbi:hypothetical protein KP509_37G057700 [Ceratopteris richardii]|uniref:Uncharacterized protein n=1 Tax=Ceratopteris richardii TaxID=49495 RepID=A0A8T2Q871_CERRI|nr:hypothetical protein KP509_37G057700 [Ceratopteris richardii]
METASHLEQEERPSTTSECSPLLSDNPTDDASNAPLQSNGSSASDAPVKKTHRLIIDGIRSNWHQSPIFAPQDKETRLENGVSILDFDFLCASVAMQRDPLSVDAQRDAYEAGVQRMWEGGVLDCFEDKEIALQTLLCPSVTYGKNLSRAGFGSCVAKAGVHFLLLATALVTYVLFLCAYGHQYLYASIFILICAASYASFYRIQIRRKFNIKGKDIDGFVSAFDDSLNHFICGCCALCQEARTLEINNVQDGNWRGRGDTIWVGSYAMPANQQGTESLELKPPVIITISSSDRSDNHSHGQTAGSSGICPHSQTG